MPRPSSCSVYVVLFSHSCRGKARDALWHLRYFVKSRGCDARQRLLLPRRVAMSAEGFRPGLVIVTQRACVAIVNLGT